jgi:hypothetical protein
MRHVTLLEIEVKLFIPALLALAVTGPKPGMLKHTRMSCSPSIHPSYDAFLRRKLTTLIPLKVESLPK